MIHEKKSSKFFRVEALSLAAHGLNRVTTRGLSVTTTPYEVMFNQKPNLSYFCVFGSLCWYKTARKQTKMSDGKAKEEITIGYARGSREYKLLRCYEQVSSSVLRRLF